jgi:hypothetical protein
VTHGFYVKNNPRQKSGDAAAWSTFAPMRLHAASPKSVCKYEYIVYSCTIGDDRGGRSNCIFGGSARLRGFVFLLKQAGSLPKEKKMIATARPQI